MPSGVTTKTAQRKRATVSSSSLGTPVPEAFHHFLSVADAYLEKHPPVVQVATRLGLKRPIYVPLIAVGLLSLLFGVFDNLITNAVGFFYPAWQSFKAIESPTPHDDRQWLTYWVVYAFFTFAELFSDVLLFWIPCYYLIKVAFLLWLFLPQFKGASIIYAQLIRPILLRYEHCVDTTLSHIVETAQTMVQSPVTPRAKSLAPPVEEESFLITQHLSPHSAFEAESLKDR